MASFREILASSPLPPLERVSETRPRVTLGELPNSIVKNLSNVDSPFYEVYEEELRLLGEGKIIQFPKSPEQTIFDYAAGDE